CGVRRRQSRYVQIVLVGQARSVRNTSRASGEQLSWRAACSVVKYAQMLDFRAVCFGVNVPRTVFANYPHGAQRHALITSLTLCICTYLASPAKPVTKKQDGIPTIVGRVSRLCRQS